MSKIGFLREGIRNLKTVGSVVRSSSYLCRAMVRPIDFQKADVIIELGAGDGAITTHILQRMKPDSRLLVFEVNDVFCERLKNNIKDVRFILIQDSAANIAEHLHRHQIKEIDYIVSAIPFVVLPEELATEIIMVCKKHLRVGGLFIQMHYSLFIKQLYINFFGNIHQKFVPLNIPPAFVFVCKKKSAY